MKMSEAFVDRFGRQHYAEEGLATPRTAYYMIIIKNRQVLLSALPRFDLFEFPGGGLNRGENYKTCLKRELYEETGYDFALGNGQAELRQKVNFFADDIRPRGEYWHYDQVFMVYDAAAYGIKIKEGEWTTPENGKAKWVDVAEIDSGKLPLNYCHKMAWDKLRRQGVIDF